MVQFSHPYMTAGKTIALTRRTFVGKVMSLLFAMLSRLARASLIVQLVKNLPAMWEAWVWSLGWEDPWRREWLPTPVFWPGEFHGLYSPWSSKELGTTEQLSLSLFHFSCHRCKHTDPQSLCHTWWAQSSWLNTYQKDKELYPPCTPQQSECDRSFFCSSE